MKAVAQQLRGHTPPELKHGLDIEQMIDQFLTDIR
jgi:hypothetical protein